jgi:hypothetical protein
MFALGVVVVLALRVGSVQFDGLVLGLLKARAVDALGLIIRITL